MVPSMDDQKRKAVAKFIAIITHLDVATATTMLKKTNWNMKRALNIYYIDLFKVCHLCINRTKSMVAYAYV